jgi:hypothetical protein
MSTRIFSIILLLAGTITMMYVMGKQGAPLSKHATTKHGGIICLELAYNNTKTQAILDDWNVVNTDGVTSVEVARKNTYLDFIFIFFYSLFLFTSSKAVNKKFGGWFGRQGKWISKGALLAGCMDMLENGGMLLSLNGKGSDMISLATAISSSIKWALVIVAVIYVFMGAIAAFRSKIKG